MPKSLERPNHYCHWPGCLVHVAPKRWGCAAHELLLPAAILRRIKETYRAGQEARMDPSPAYIDAMTRAHEWAYYRGKRSANSDGAKFKVITTEETMSKKKSAIGEAIDEIYAMDLKIAKESAKLAAKIKPLQAQRVELEEALRRRVKKEKLTSGKGKHAALAIVKRSFPSIKFRKKLDRWIRKNKAYDLYQNRLNSRAYFDRVKQGEEPDGVEVFSKDVMLITKRRS